MRRQGSAKHVVAPRTLVFCERGGKRLFLEGAAGKWFAGKLNGLGGGVERGEDVAAAAAREVEEECGLRPVSMRLVAIVNVDADPCVMLFVYSAVLPAGRVPPEGPEGRLVWLTPRQVASPARPFLADVRAYLAAIDTLPAGAPPLSLAVRW